MGSFGPRCHECTLDRAALFLPEAGKEAFLTAGVDDAGEVRLGVRNHASPNAIS